MATSIVTGAKPIDVSVNDFCHALIAQPELSTTSSIAVSYYGVEDARPMMATSPW